MKTLNLPVTLAGIWIIAMMLLYYFKFGSIITIGAFSSLLFTLLITLGSIYQKVQKEGVIEDYGRKF